MLEPKVLLHGGEIVLIDGVLTYESESGLVIEGTDFDQTFIGSHRGDRFRTGSGAQLVDGGQRRDHFISHGDAGEPDPAQTDGAEGRVNDPVPEGTGDDVFIGGAGGDLFEFRPLINAQQEVLDQYRNHISGKVNWRRVAGENDNVHEHWVEGIGNDTIMDYSKDEGDRILVAGHTASLVGIRYGDDEGGAFSLIVIRSDQSGMGGGAHDGDPLGAIKVYGDEVTPDDVEINAGVFYGMERLNEANRLAEHNGGGSREVISGTDGDSFSGGGRVKDLVNIGRGSQKIDAGAGRDIIVSYGDAGEPDPAQTDGAEGRVNDPVDSDLADDVLRGGQDRDLFVFKPLINAKQEIIEKYTRRDGRVNWRGVAGENDNVHDHWVEGVGEDVIIGYDEGDGDQIRVAGHTASIADIVYGRDDGGHYSLIILRSDQSGMGGGAHDGDPLGTIKVYGDEVTEDDVEVNAGVFYGINQLDELDEHDNSAERAAGAHGAPSDALIVEELDYTAEHKMTGSGRRDRIFTGAGRQYVDGGRGNDYFISYGDAGEPDPAQTDGSNGRVNRPVPDGLSDDVFVGGLGADTFEFVPLINAKVEVLDQYRNHDSGQINWQNVAGENDNVHDHWVEGVGDDVIKDYNESQGDVIKLTGHTVSIAAIEYGSDDGGHYSLIIIRSDQSGMGGGAHDGDPLGAIKVYGDEVTEDDVIVNAGVFYGMERLFQANYLAEHNGGGRRVVRLGEDGDSYTGGARVQDLVAAGRGSQTVDTGAGNDVILSLGDAGEPDPAQTDGSEGRVNEPVDPELADDVFRGGLGRDVFLFRPLINAKQEIIEKHTRDDGRVNWRRVAGENDNVHDHWVEGIGDDVILDYDKGDGDQIKVHGHTASIADIIYGADEGGEYSLIVLRSDQSGNGGGAHDGDPLGTIKVYGDRVEADDVQVRANVFYGINQLDEI